MPVISRGDALMRDATGGDEAQGGERERGDTAHRGRAVSSRAKDESLMRSQPRDYPARSRGRLYVCYKVGMGAPGRHVPQECHYTEEGRGKEGWDYEFANGAPDNRRRTSALL